MDTKLKIKKNSSEKLLEAQANFIEGSGRIAVSLLGILNRVCGQIYALLYLSPEALSLDDIVTELGVSKGNVSINIRILEDYQLVKKVWVKGTRKDYYVAVAAVPSKIIQEFFEKIRRNIHDSLDMILDSSSLVKEIDDKNLDPDTETKVRFMKARLDAVRSFYEGANVLIEAIYAGTNLDTSLLKPILKRS
ncbi:MAG: hypothetical protein A3G32_04010 [Deltaproteobacteria bacterium RIFCSPLOWO2_12_FULL_40_28]|nr:MAG: hypothetical protein A3C45_06095 [Deltaproteobacteria bacterium RIFCSPHIGHO2_02_FULL_40_28]OGQ20487.1 MAG: hypothetical protein A3E27_01890 [Deltaproteobacteria bacterium RIFCSPHIGHO2_12_FULL_40_32]OGQ41117.1 MAG: hypothetical protein A3I69_08755 [Deltaproteobacteria bacterium RIFCSPLOWO2_02_FULL_40_36]OGQ55097.1 MAG: hypothetical protein A3G32_04010 [Deltaproteobacteria bacterium RIFCSPLOWO2_12_FULL_40_28]